MATFTKNDFVLILQKFADAAEDIMVERETIIGKINGEDISLTLYENDDDILCCTEKGQNFKAKSWIEKRLAKFDELASKIEQYIEKDPLLISVSAIKDVDEPTAEIKSDASQSIFEELFTKVPFNTKAIYLLSEAGEGKTKIMDRIALTAAKQYKEGNTHCLFLPISLSGRPFLRIDDLVIGTLASQYRFRGFYFEAIIELVKQDLLILGLDGFEEMAVEGTDGKIISSIGELLQQLDSRGKILISARRAYYNYALKYQAPIVNAISSLDVEFSSYRLSAWKQKEFCDLLSRSNFLPQESSDIYSSLAERLGEAHPILQRPVLARRLVSMLSDEKKAGRDYNAIVNSFDKDKNPEAVVDNFIQSLLTREANEKWLSRSGKIRMPLLSVKEHFELLQMIAEEMWMSCTEFLKKDVLQEITILFCEQIKKTPTEARDCQEKILTHAMLREDGGRYSFCHDTFRQFFLWKLIANYIIKGEMNFRLMKILSHDALPDGSIIGISYELSKNNVDFEKTKASLNSLKGGISKTSLISQNIGGILIKFLSLQSENNQTEIKDLFLSSFAMGGTHLKNLKLSDCVIEEIDLETSRFVNVEFQNCSISSIRLSHNKTTSFVGFFDEASIPSHLFLIDEEEDIYTPEVIKDMLSRIGFSLGGLKNTEAEPHGADEELSVFSKIVRFFSRTSGISGNVLALKFGANWPSYEKKYIPIFIKEGLLARAKWAGSDKDTRYRLGMPMEKYEYAQKNCNGSFKRFVELCK